VLYEFVLSIIYFSMAMSISSMASAASLEQNEFVEEIVVTALRRKDTLDTVPISVSVLSGKDIEKRDIQEFKDLARYIPNISAGGDAIRMRGFGTNLYGEQSVGIYVDDIYLPRSFLIRGTLLDLERVEVLRGPQSSLFGKNTIAGAVNIITQKPSLADEQLASLSYGTFGHAELVGTINAKISDELYVRTTLQKLNENGYVRNNYVGETGPQDEYQTMRTSLLWLPTTETEYQTKLEYGKIDENGTPAQLVQAGDYDSLFKSYDPLIEYDLDNSSSVGGILDTFYEASKYLYSSALKHDINGYETNLLIGYNYFHKKDAFDGESTPVPLLAVSDSSRFRHLSGEFRVVSPDTSTYRYFLGVYYDRTNENITRTDFINIKPIASLFFPDFASFILSRDSIDSAQHESSGSSESYSLYFHSDYDITHSTTVSGSIRYIKESKAGKLSLELLENGTPATNTGLLLWNSQGWYDLDLDDELSSDAILPAIAIQYTKNKNQMFYGLISTGFKSGGYNILQTMNNAEAFHFDEEISYSVEIGSKLAAFTNSKINLSTFYTPYKDLQVLDLNKTQFLVQNAAEAVSTGVELDWSTKVNNSITLGGFYTYLDAHYLQYPNAPRTDRQAIANLRPDQDLSGRPLQYAPYNKFNLYINYTKPFVSDWILDVWMDAGGQSSFYYTQDDDSIDSQGSYSKINSTWSLGNRRIGVSYDLIFKNLTNRLTKNNGVDASVLENGAHWAIADPPRTVAIRVTGEF